MLVFESFGEIDPLFINSFGVSVKEKDDAIGRFGTGLKYAIAIILREGGSIKILSGIEVFKLSAEKEMVRGEEFHFIYLNGERLSYTTELGKDWQLWEAYRELYCNNIDEGDDNKISIQPDDVISIGQSGVTRIEISAIPAIEEIYKNHGDYFLDVDIEPFTEIHGFDVYEGESHFIYYQGVQVYDAGDEKFQYTCNINDYASLTENRTLAYPSYVINQIRDSIIICENKEIIRNTLSSKREDFIESRFVFSDSEAEPSEAFKEVSAELKFKDELINESALIHCVNKKPLMARVELIDEGELSPYGKRKIRKINNVLRNIFSKKNKPLVKVVRFLPCKSGHTFCEDSYTMFITKERLQQQADYTSPMNLIKLVIKNYATIKPDIIDDLLKAVDKRYFGKLAVK